MVSKDLLNRVPPEIWRAILAWTIDPYHILLIDDSVRETSNEPLNEVSIDNNHPQDILNMCLVSKVFRESIRSVFRNSFSGRLYFWFGNFRPEICTLIKTKMASRVKRIDIHMSGTETPTLQAFESEWSQFIRSGGFPNLQEVRVFAPYTVNYDEHLDLAEDELDMRVIEEVARIKNVVATAGLDASVPSAFRILAYIRDESLVVSGVVIDATQIGLSGRAIADQWKRRCNIPISCQQLTWLWSNAKKESAST